jgi:PAS domain S-box-containing protein
MLGWSREELVGQPVSKVSTPASVALAAERTRRFLAGEKLPASTFEAELLCKEGSMIPVEARTRAIRDREGRPVGFQGIYRDISAKKALELQRANFLAMLTHDIKTPLSAVLGYLDLLAEESAGRRSAAEDRFLQRLRDNALIMNSLIANYLDFAKAEAGKLVLHKTPQAVSEILRQVRAQYGAMARRHHLTFTLDLAPELPLINGDPLALERIFANLVHNALKFTPQKGRVTISTRHQANDESTVVVEVRNSGPGIAPEEIALLFERYRRVSTVVRPHEGTGLGLFIVKTLVEAHGGRIEVESNPGSGTCFRVLLSAAP